MKRSPFLPFLALAGAMLIVALACNLTGAAQPTTAPTPVPPTQPPPTKAIPTIQITFPTATQAPVVTQPPAAAGPLDFFTEEFTTDLNENWDSFYINAGSDTVHDDDIQTSIVDGEAMRFEIKTSDTYVYEMYTPYSYTDVTLSARFENQGVNSQNLSLICRATENGWYEFSVGSDSMWQLYAYDGNDSNYHLLASGAAATLKQGHEVNDLKMICSGDTISMFVNDTELPYSPFKPINYFFSEGEVGFNISSLTSTPVITEIYWFDISQP